jgi:hypothetical protein
VISFAALLKKFVTSSVYFFFSAVTVAVAAAVAVAVRVVVVVAAEVFAVFVDVV